MLVCKNCGLGQISEDLPPERLFENYPFKTSVSTSFVKHAADFAEECIQKLSLNHKDWVLEIASNDGYFLKNFLDRGISILGIEPAKNISLYAVCDGIPVYNEFLARLWPKTIEIKRLSEANRCK